MFVFVCLKRLIIRLSKHSIWSSHSKLYPAAVPTNKRSGVAGGSSQAMLDISNMMNELVSEPWLTRGAAHSRDPARSTGHAILHTQLSENLAKVIPLSVTAVLLIEFFFV